MQESIRQEEGAGWGRSLPAARRQGGRRASLIQAAPECEASAEATSREVRTFASLFPAIIQKASIERLVDVRQLFWGERCK